MAPHTIRPATEGDLTAILRLYQEPEFDDQTVLDLDSARRIFERMRSYPDYTLYVVDCGGEIVATFALLIMDNLAHLGARSGILEDLCVRGDRRGEGIGRTIMTFALEKCRLASCYKLALSSSVKRAGAHRFYDSLAFNRYGVCFSVPLSEEAT